MGWINNSKKPQTKTTKNNNKKIKFLHLLYICVTFYYAPGDTEYINKAIYCNGLEEEITDPLLITGAYSVMDCCGFMHVIFSVLM